MYCYVVTIAVAALRHQKYIFFFENKCMAKILFFSKKSHTFAIQILRTMELNARFDHFNFNVADLDRSIAFYEKALGLTVARRKEGPGGAFTSVFLTDRITSFTLELTWLRDHPQPYDLGECEYHLCLRVPGDYAEVRRYHKELGCVCFENHEMGLYFIEDPDGYWIEILPVK